MEVADFARKRGIRVRSVDERHRRLLRCKGVETPDLLVGRMSEDEPVLPEEIRAVLRGEGTWGWGVEVVEWVVHPGRAGGAVGSDYDAGREEDLRILLRLANRPELREIRRHRRLMGRVDP